MFTVPEYYRMAEAGILSPVDRVELIEGEIVEMPPIGSRHASEVGRLTQVFGQSLGDRFLVWVQNPIRLDEYSEPEPDIALLKPRTDFYAEAHPGPQDVVLVVEVGDTTAEYDRRVKVPLYARSGILEVWLIDIPRTVILVYTEPIGGVYRVVRQIHRGETLAPTCAPDMRIEATSILG
jgi:Uma2 family endonuclease